MDKIWKSEIDYQKNIVLRDRNIAGLGKDITEYRVNRQPSLHEYAMFAAKVRLVDDYAIHYPIAQCGPLNADFDGDTVSIQLVPEESAEETYNRMSPKYVTTYKKSGEPLQVFNHETLNGLAVASEYTPKDPDDLQNPKHFYDDYKKLLRDVEVDKKIEIGTPITFTGKIGTEEYKAKTTTYGRLRLSKIIGADIDKLGLFKNPYDRITAGAATKLTIYVSQLPDGGVEVRRSLQKFALKAVTLAGVVTFDYKTLYADTDSELYKEICKIADSKELTDQQKLALLTEKYAKFEKETEGKFSDDLKKELSMAARVKLNSIVALTMPQLIISGVDERPVITRGSLLTGYNEKDFQYHAIENRSLQSIKVSGVFSIPEQYRSPL